MMKVTN